MTFIPDVRKEEIEMFGKKKKSPYYEEKLKEED